MSSTCQEMLRSFGSNTDWNYAVFWKLINHQSLMVLTLEDAYYDNQATATSAPEVQGCGVVIPKNIHEGHQAHDLLGLAIAKMSYHVYSLGEGIVGQVAVSGEHQWVFPEYYDNFHSAFEFRNVWEGQISAGIKTVLVVAVGLCGVVQLGSYRKVDEDVALVNRIRHLFFGLEDPLADHAANLMQCNMKAFPVCSGEGDKATKTRYETRRSDSMPYNTSSSSSRLLIENTAQLTGVGGSSCGTYSGVEFSGCKDPRGLDPNLCRYLENHGLNNTSSSSSAFAVQAESLITSQSYPSMISSEYTIAGTELLEALGSSYKQTSDSNELVKSEHGSTTRPTDDMSHRQLPFDSDPAQNQPWIDQGLTNYRVGPRPENLLDVVVANMCHSEGNAMDDALPSRSIQSLLTSTEIAEPSGQKKHMNQLPSAEVDTRQNPSDICGAFSSIGFSSTCPSSSSGQFRTSLEMPKKIKNRAKRGESTRPRPRDRQLIQDRIKELRELVPNGSKCSIDSLLERTIKHMLFLQNVTKHAEKLSKSANIKMQQKETGTQGSSCAVEVGGHLQVYSIIVENLNKNGMVLIEMLCEECSHFLEIANMIKTLDLTILRGVTETHGDKSWICFVVESQNKKVMQRMEILLSLVQMFKPKGEDKM